MSQLVSWEMQGQIAILKFSNPPANAVNGKFLIDLNFCLNEIELEESVKAMVVMSTRESIFATSDLGRTGGEKKENVTKIKLFDEASKRIKAQPFPSIAIVSGFALGEGFELALTCNYRMATKSARFGSLNGACPTKLGEASLISLIGLEKAKEVMEFGKIYGGIEAKRIGIVDRIISAPPLLNEGMEIEKLVYNQLGKVIKAGKRFWKSSSNKNELEKGICNK